MINQPSLAVSVVWCLVLTATLLAQGLSDSFVLNVILYFLLVVGGCIVYPIVALSSCFQISGENSSNSSTAMSNSADVDDVSEYANVDDSTDEIADIMDPTAAINDTSGKYDEENFNVAIVVLGNETPECHQIYFLDNVKTFLTMVIVSHHVGCAFGGAGANSWYLIVGDYDSKFNRISKSIMQLNQGYFMSLFFFISAYFTPSSYEKKGKWEFHKEKALRLSLPLIGTTLCIVPISIMIGVGTTANPIFYFPTIGHAWFILWLILLNVVYSTIIEADEFISSSSGENAPAPPDEQRTVPFPNTNKRLFVGIVICGCLMLAVATLLDFQSFMGMPITIGSLVCDILFFYLGTCFKQHGWLEKSLHEQIDVPVWLLRFGAILEAGTMCVLSSLLENGHFAWALLYLPVAGLFCVDMSLVVLELFQSYAEFSTPITRFFSDGAYTVYIIHPIVVTGLTAIFVMVYRAGDFGSEIEFDGGFFGTASSTKLAGPDNGGGTLALGCIAVNIVSHLILWPLAWQLKQLPGLRHIL